MKLTHISGQEPKIGDELELLFDKWSDKQAYLLNKDGGSWLSFETSKNERLSFLKALLKKWLE